MIVGMAGETTSCSIAVTIIATRSAAVTFRRPAISRRTRRMASLSLLRPDCARLRSLPSASDIPDPFLISARTRSVALYGPANPDTSRAVPGSRVRRESSACLDRIPSRARPISSGVSANLDRGRVTGVRPDCCSQTGCVNAPLQATSQASSRTQVRPAQARRRALASSCRTRSCRTGRFAGDRPFSHRRRPARRIGAGTSSGARRGPRHGPAVLDRADSVAAAHLAVDREFRDQDLARGHEELPGLQASSTRLPALLDSSGTRSSRT